MTLTRQWQKSLVRKGLELTRFVRGMIATKFHDDFTKDQVRVKVANSGHHFAEKVLLRK